MTESETNKENLPKALGFFKKRKVPLIWASLIVIYLYVTLLPEIMFVNASGLTVDHVEIVIPGDEKVWRNIKHGASKGFRYQPSSETGEYKISLILSDGSRIKTAFKGIESWNMGHKAIIELTPDMKLRIDFTYSLF